MRLISHRNAFVLPRTIGLQVLAGDVESAIKSHQVYAHLWERYRGLPEVFSIADEEAVSLAYPVSACAGVMLSFLELHVSCAQN